MSRRRKKRGCKKASLTENILLAAAILELVKVLWELYKTLIE